MRRAALVVALALLAPAPARADADGDAIVHKVKKGDTLELLAAEYYGDRNHEIFIMVANGMDSPRPLVPGEKLKIPATREVTADVGDSFDSLAGTLLGDKRRGKFLAQFNGLDPDDSLAAGTVLTIPFQVAHTAAGPETLADLATAFLGDAKEAALLRAYNFLDHDTLAAGEAIVIPIHDVKVRASKMPPTDKASQERSDKRKRMRTEALVIVPESLTAWHDGEYGAVKRELNQLEPDFLDAGDAALVGVLLGCAYVATGDADTAIDKFQHVLERSPGYTLDAYTYSPKIRAVWQKAGGKVSDD